MSPEVRVINYKPYIRLIDVYIDLGMNKKAFKRYLCYMVLDSPAMIKNVDYVETWYKRSMSSPTDSFNYGISTSVAKGICYMNKTAKARELLDWIVELERQHFIFA